MPIQQHHGTFTHELTHSAELLFELFSFWQMSTIMFENNTVKGESEHLARRLADREDEVLSIAQQGQKQQSKCLAGQCEPLQQEQALHERTKRRLGQMMESTALATDAVETRVAMLVRKSDSLAATCRRQAQAIAAMSEQRRQ